MDQINKAFIELIKINKKEYNNSLNKFNKKLNRFEKIFINFCIKNVKAYKWNCLSFKNKIFIEDGYLDFIQYDKAKKYLRFMSIFKGGWGSYFKLESFYNYSSFDNCLKVYKNIYKELLYEDNNSVTIENLLNSLEDIYKNLKYNMEELLKSYLISFKGNKLTIKDQIKFETCLIMIYDNYIKGFRLVDEKILIKLLDLSSGYFCSYDGGIYNVDDLRRKNKRKKYVAEVEFKYFPINIQVSIINKLEELYNNGSIVETFKS